MRTPTTLLCAVLLSCSGCATPSWNASPAPPKPIACSAEALARCEAPEIEAEDAPLGDSEEVDTVNRHRWERCVLRHNAALACFRALQDAGVLNGGGGR